MSATSRPAPYAPLLVALAGLLVLPALVGPVLQQPVFLHLAMALVLTLAIYALSGKRQHLWIALALGVPSTLARLLASVLESHAFQLLTDGLAVLFLVFVIALIFRDVLQPGRVGPSKLTGAVCIYLILGLTWALLYAMLYNLEPGSFAVPDEIATRSANPLGTQPAFLYFSFVTLTTLGYGDIAPIGPRAQTLAWTQAVVGQLFLAILIGRLVGLAWGGETAPEDSDFW